LMNTSSKAKQAIEAVIQKIPALSALEERVRFIV